MTEREKMNRIKQAGVIGGVRPRLAVRRSNQYEVRIACDTILAQARSLHEAPGVLGVMRKRHSPDPEASGEGQDLLGLAYGKIEVLRLLARAEVVESAETLMRAMGGPDDGFFAAEEKFRNIVSGPF
ncbi:hypothetical protein ABT282_08855 [Streptomyces sp. NPDC000927]|uniref:hypothetical protein n=1 Tax=Streptomyces sp. NPDC000927 TaxID=3154371 RepID=UPI003332C9AE